MRNTGIAGNFLAIEITESVVIDDIEQVTRTLSRLRRHGVRIDLDDFGTGYSSMSYLETLPIDTLKIDQAFIKTIDSTGRGGVIAKLILDMARSLNKMVVAEGVEQQEQLDFLRQHGCDVGQGFLFSKPLAASAFTTFVSRWNLMERNDLFPSSPVTMNPTKANEA